MLITYFLACLPISSKPYSKLKPYLNTMNMKDRKKIVNSKLKSILDYGLPLFMGENAQVRAKLEAAYMLINRVIHGGYTFRVNKTTICDEIKTDMPLQSICKTAATFLHKHLTHRKCDSLINQLVIPKKIASHIYVRNP